MYRNTTSSRRQANLTMSPELLKPRFLNHSLRFTYSAEHVEADLFLKGASLGGVGASLFLAAIFCDFKQDNGENRRKMNGSLLVAPATSQLSTIYYIL